MNRAAQIVLLVGLLLASTIGRAADLPWVPRTVEHFNCVFSDGSYAEYKKIKKWFPYAEAIPHAQTSADWKSLTYYVDQRGKRLEIHLPVQFGCEEVGKADGQLFYRNGYQNKAGDFLLVGLDGELAPFKLIPQISRPQEPGCTASNRDPLLLEKGIYEFVLCGGGWMMRERGQDEIVAEIAVSARGNHPAHPVRGVVQYVFRTTYSRASKSWSPIELIGDGVIYEIGKTLKNQSWAPKYRCLVDRPRGGCDKKR